MRVLRLVTRPISVWDSLVFVDAAGARLVDTDRIFIPAAHAGHSVIFSHSSAFQAHPALVSLTSRAILAILFNTKIDNSLSSHNS